MTLRCPLCLETLALTEKTACCPQGHSFDRAREGYFNLLPVQKKNSLDPGDDADMVAARHAFLEAGFYAPLRDTLMGLIAPLQPRHLLDSGCGEGWYTTAIATLASTSTAFDISKSAVRGAAKGRPGTTWLVASSNDIPLPDACVDVMTAIFSPVNATEAARVMKPGARLLIAAPGEQHLWELRDALYPEVRPHQAGKWEEELSPPLPVSCGSPRAIPPGTDGQHPPATAPENDPALLARLPRAPQCRRATPGLFHTGRLPPAGLPQDLITSAYTPSQNNKTVTDPLTVNLFPGFHNAPAWTCHRRDTGKEVDMNSQTIAERIAGTPGSWNDAPLCKRLAGLLQEEAGMGAGKDDETGDGFPEWHRQPPTHTAIRHSER